MKRRNFILGTIWGGLCSFKKEQSQAKVRWILGGCRVGKSIHNPYPKADFKLGCNNENILERDYRDAIKAHYVYCYNYYLRLFKERDC